MFHRRKEMEELSEALEKLINGERIASETDFRDSLQSKIRHQLIRLQDKICGTEERLTAERDEIRLLIAETAHQMRNPLANLESYLTLLEGSDCSPAQRDYLSAAAQSEEKLRLLTENFIRMARLESRIIQLDKNAENLEETVLSSVLQARRGAEEKQIEITLNARGTVCARHDPFWLGEALYNVLDNSVKYSPEGGQISISLSAGELYARITVRDFGEGICEGEEPLIFGRFYRGKNAGGRPGLGLGLYICREILLLHGGFVKVRRMSRGLSVSLYLPAGGRGEKKIP